VVNVVDEVIVCLPVLSPDSRGEHRHADPCFEVRTCVDTQGDDLELSDLMTSGLVVVDGREVHAAPAGLLNRKTAFYGRLVKRIRDQENRDQTAAGALLDDLGRLVDLYLFADEFTSRHWRGEPGPRAAREAFDKAARYLLEHRRDSGLGRQRHHILADVIRALRAGPAIPEAVKAFDSFR
jgi:hypothetical protein